MVEKIVGYVPKAETKLNLGDGSFVEPDLAQGWIDAILDAGDYPYVGRGRYGHYQGLNEELVKRIEAIVKEVQGEREDGIFVGDTIVDLEGDSSTSKDGHDATIRISLASFLPNSLVGDRKLAEQVEAQNLQDHAFVSYRLADHMVETVTKLEELKRAEAAERQAKHATTEARAAV